jgi:hypothetical protein
MEASKGKSETSKRDKRITERGKKGRKLVKKD